MSTVKVGKTEFGSGMPNICIPITGRSEEIILGQAERIAGAAPDVVEWRVDFYEKASDLQAVLALAEGIAEKLGEIPVLFTFRSANEGGEQAITPEDYSKLNLAVAESGRAALVDIEAFMPGLAAAELIAKLKKLGVAVITSNHHFHETPSLEEMLRIFNKMAKTGTDIRKLAVMPAGKLDVVHLLEATAIASEDGLGPVITMSMGALGGISRVSGETFGSCMTYAALGAASAPGQFEVEDERTVQKILHETFAK